MPDASTLPLHSARRLWQAFLSARVLVALLLVAVLGMQTWSSPGLTAALTASWLLTMGYLMVALLGWVLLHQRPPGSHWGWPWLLLLAADVCTICLLQMWQISKIHYTPLLALTVLSASLLGHIRLALATTAIITLLLLSTDALSTWSSRQRLDSEDYLQTALVCAGFFAIAYLAHMLGQRLAYQERQTRQSRQAARTQAQVNSLIIDNLSEGVLVVDDAFRVRMANPAACELLGLPAPVSLQDLYSEPAWQPLRDMVTQSYATHRAMSEHVQILHRGQAPMGLHVRTWLTASLETAVALPELGPEADSMFTPQSWMCVMFLHDLRAIEARMRTEKMAAMGRMSAAVAHEIRNPLAAIVQANALLSEELPQPSQQRLCLMVEQNAQRLARIAEDVLDIARVQQQMHHTEAKTLALDTELHTIWQEWQQQVPQERAGLLHLTCPQAHIVFDAEHMRRVAINLLDNAARHRLYAEQDSLQVSTTPWHNDFFELSIWSEGPPLDASVEKHLFEPFFSSQSRSTGLGLFICRELCQRHGGRIRYERLQRMTQRGMQPGNAFIVTFRGSLITPHSPSLFESNVV